MRVFDFELYYKVGKTWTSIYRISIKERMAFSMPLLHIEMRKSWKRVPSGRKRITNVLHNVKFVVFN